MLPTTAVVIAAPRAHQMALLKPAYYWDGDLAELATVSALLASRWNLRWVHQQRKCRRTS
jgi:hypothetical protein